MASPDLGRKRAPGAALSTAQYTALVERIFDEAFQREQFGVIDELYWPDSVYHSSLRPKASSAVVSVKYSISELLRALSDCQHEVSIIAAQGTTVVARLRVIGKHTFPLLRIPATGQELCVEGLHVIGFAGARVAEHQVYVNLAGLLRQLAGHLDDANTLH